MENRDCRFLILASSVFLLLGAGCSSVEKTPHHPHVPPGVEITSENGHGGDLHDKPSVQSDFSPEYQRQMEQAETAAEQKKQKAKKRDKRLDEMINRDDRRERK
ncbi:MAG: hypothetical protein K2X47_06100 [Bdellovibrionales bacterium]|nr:hypothetical protein [Bdellovibrionales bacterium]